MNKLNKMNELLRGLDAEGFSREREQHVLSPGGMKQHSIFVVGVIYLIKQGVRAVDTGGRQGLDPKGPCDISHSKGWGRS